MTGADVALSVFTILSIVRIVAYFPQILKIASDAGGASSISITTWSMFALSHAATSVYALASLGDLALTVVFGANAALCTLIVAMTATRRRRFLREASDANADEPSAKFARGGPTTSGWWVSRASN